MGASLAGGCRFQERVRETLGIKLSCVALQASALAMPGVLTLEVVQAVAVAWTAALPPASRALWLRMATLTCCRQHGIVSLPVKKNVQMSLSLHLPQWCFDCSPISSAFVPVHNFHFHLFE